MALFVRVPYRLIWRCHSVAAAPEQGTIYLVIECKDDGTSGVMEASERPPWEGRPWVRNGARVLHWHSISCMLLRHFLRQFPLAYMGVYSVLYFRAKENPRISGIYRIL